MKGGGRNLSVLDCRASFEGEKPPYGDVRLKRPGWPGKRKGDIIRQTFYTRDRRREGRGKEIMKKAPKGRLGGVPTSR